MNVYVSNFLPWSDRGTPDFAVVIAGSEEEARDLLHERLKNDRLRTTSREAYRMRLIPSDKPHAWLEFYDERGAANE